MLTTYKAGSICGDWHHLLEPFGLLPFDQWVAGILVWMGVFCFIMALWGVWDYIFYAEEHLRKDPKEEF